jgi:hypothetical protein
MSFLPFLFSLSVLLMVFMMIHTMLLETPIHRWKDNHKIGFRELVCYLNCMRVGMQWLAFEVTLLNFGGFVRAGNFLYDRITLVGYLTTLSVSIPYSVDDIMINECGAVGGMRIGRETRSTLQRIPPRALCPPNVLIWDWTLCAAVGSWRLTASAITRPICWSCKIGRYITLFRFGDWKS